MSFDNESKIFKNELALSTEYLPEILPHRENQIKVLADNLDPAAHGRKPQNTFVFGAPGIGKTATTKFVFKEFEDTYPNVKTIYINCWDYKTIVSVLTKIGIDLEAFVQRRGVGKDEILERIIEVCKKSNKGIIICLDEIDQLIFNEPESLYDLLRINQYLSNPIGLVFISNNPNVFFNLEPRIESSLDIEGIEFRAYSLMEMKDILHHRATQAFISFENTAILLAASHAITKGGDVRVGLEILMKAGRFAEENGSEKVTVDCVKSILSTVKPVKPEILKERVPYDEKIILEILDQQKRKQMFTGDLYKAYSEKIGDPVSERRFRDFIGHLAQINLIQITERKRGVKGKKRLVTKL